MACTFDRAWQGPCGREDCKEHANLVCCSCGAKATRSCPECLRFGVCGESLCDNCAHNDSGQPGPWNHEKRTT